MDGSFVGELPEDKFDVRDTGKKFITIVCRRCGQVWKWPREKPLNVGSKLHLLNHHAGHVEGNGKEETGERE